MAWFSGLNYVNVLILGCSISALHHIIKNMAYSRSF